MSDSDDESTPSDLSDQLFEHMVESAFDRKQEFLPESHIENLINRRSIEVELYAQKQTFTSDEVELADFVENHAKKVFATAFSILTSPGQLAATMRFFRKCGFTDSRLPMSDIRRLDTSRNAPAEFPFPFREIEDEEVRRIWKRSLIKSFYKTQWKFLAPIFSSDNFNLNLSPDCVLPFIWVNSITKGGRFSSVYEVQIHQDHQRNTPENTGLSRVAIKAIHSAEGDEILQQEVLRNFNIEAKALGEITELQHKHIIERIAAITQGSHHYFMFQWADGGNLREFWASQGRPNLSSELIEQSVQQICGLAGALSSLHHFKDDVAGNYRHGDLKPENILRFEDGTIVGTLKIADMGLAKHHPDVTEDRQFGTSTKYGTARYEPPEVSTNRLNTARSRLYDVWSLGCIMLEYVIWLLYGQDELQLFNDSITAAGGCFYEVSTENHRQVARVHPNVIRWMDLISKDPECTVDSAIGDLLLLIRKRLLIVALQTGMGTQKALSTAQVEVTPAEAVEISSQGPFRAHAFSVCSALDRILSRGRNNERYLLANSTRLEINRPSRANPSTQTRSSLQVPVISRSKSPSRKEPKTPPINTSKDYGLSLNDTWSFYTDNKVVGSLMRSVKHAPPGHGASRPHQLCSQCNDLDMSSPTFAMSRSSTDLLHTSTVCDFCRLLIKVCNSYGLHGQVRLRKDGSTLRINDCITPLLSLIRTPGLLESSNSLSKLLLTMSQVDGDDSTSSINIQDGYPRLSSVRHPRHFDIIRQWLKDCDEDPEHCACQPEETPRLPTRLLDVSGPQLRLVKTKFTGTPNTQYLALSHPWGDADAHAHFCTYTHNIKKHESGIDLYEIPATFKDAVTVTRELGFRYLWIDSLCIIQGPDGDFAEESVHMEDVFSSASCVLAASRATGQCDGFLGPRYERDYVTFSRSDGEEYHICEMIDNFQADVVDGALNKRGWVLQERALARRTVYFTEKQTYWECGGGIRCETFTKLKNNIAAFLGDPKFPDVAMRSSRGERIYLYQKFYKQYSGLQFTKIEDRPFAIAGLEKRLLHAFGTYGGYGVFDDGKGLLQRSLLWHRPSNGSLKRIEFPSERDIFVPSWSWMAYEGGIDYLDPKFAGFDWEQKELGSPWVTGTATYYTTDKKSKIFLDVTVRNYDKDRAGKKRSELYLDTPLSVDDEASDLKCVVLARSKIISSMADRECYVLIVRPQVSMGYGESGSYERVGVGRMPESYIVKSPATAVKLY